MKKNNLAIAKIIIGICMMTAALIGYIPEPELMVEFSFMSNVTGGLALLIDGILNLKGRSIPAVIHRNICAGLFIVFAVCMLSLTGAYHMNFKGAFFFIHVVFPLLYMLCYVFACDDSKGKTIRKLFASPVLMILYFVFDYILGQCRGFFVYGFAEVEELSVLAGLIVLASVYVLVFFISWGLLALNRKFRLMK